MLALLAALLLSQNTNSFPYSKGVAVQGAASDGGNAQAYGLICTGALTCSGSNFGWVTLNASGSSDGGGGGSGAPTNASYITKVSESGLSAEFAMASLSTGLVKNTTTTGVPSIYAGTSCSNQFPRSLDSSGAASCASVSLTADVTGTLPLTSGGTGSGGFTCSSGQVITSNGTAYSCTATITASDLSCSGCVSLTSEVSGITPIANGGTGTSSLSCATNQAISSDGGALYCSSAFVTGPGGSSPQVQYNNAGVFGGIANVTSDGTHILKTPVSAIPSAPAEGTLHYDYFVDSGFPSVSMIVDSFTGLHSPVGMLGEMFSTVKSWDVECITTQGWGTNTLLYYRHNPVISTAGSLNSDAWATTSLLTRSKMNTYSSTLGNANLQVGIKNSGQQSFWRGNAAGAGGFFLWQRASLKTSAAHTRWFFGARNSTSIIGTTAEPSAETDTVYFGCDNGNTNLSICSNDNDAGATCNSLGSSFPCTTSGAWYDFWLYSAPGASEIDYAVERLDSAQFTSGTVTSDLPRNTVQLNWQQYGSTADGGQAIVLGFFGMCFAEPF
jgi:hypothetical protein